MCCFHGGDLSPAAMMSGRVSPSPKSQKCRAQLRRNFFSHTPSLRSRFGGSKRLTRDHTQRRTQAFELPLFEHLTQGHAERRVLSALQDGSSFCGFKGDRIWQSPRPPVVLKPACGRSRRNLASPRDHAGVRRRATGPVHFQQLMTDATAARATSNWLTTWRARAN